MTLLDDPPVRRLPAEPQPERTTLATWRFASRLARREVRRRPGRTLLVALLVAAPVMAMTVAAVMYRTMADDQAATFERRYGGADLALSVGLTDDIDSELRDALPRGSRVVDSVATWTGFEVPPGEAPVDAWVRFTDLPLDDPLTAGIVEIRRGRAPSAPDEMLLDARTAERFAVDVGDTFELARPAGTWSVVGIGRLTDNHSEGLVVVHEFDRDRLRPERSTRYVLVEFPAGTSQGEQLAVANEVAAGSGAWVDSPLFNWDRPSDDARVLAWGWVVGVLALAAVGIVIAAAFATSARRQLVTIGHLAANGAPAALVRRTLALQGTWTGVAGVLGGMGLAVTGLLVFRPFLEHVANRSIGSYRLVPADLAVIAVTAIIAATVAAAIPARTAARIPVLSALSGRRPLTSPSRRLVPTGVTLFLGGLGLLFVAATGATASSTSGGNADVFAFVAVLGGLGVVFGMCCATPLVIALVGRLGGRASGTWRLAARSTARVRTRSAGVVTAVATAGAFAVAGVTIAAMSIDDSVSSGSLPRDVVYIEPWSDWYGTESDGLLDIPPPDPFQLDPAMRTRLEALLPDASFDMVRAAVIDPRPFDPEVGLWEPGSVAELRVDPRVATIADAAVLELADISTADLGLLDEFDLIESAGAYGFVVDDDGSGGGVVEPDSVPASPPVVLADRSGDIEVTRAFHTSGRSTWPVYNLMAVERADALGLDVIDVGMLVRNPTDLTAAERREVLRIVGDSSVIETAFVEPGDTRAADERDQQDLVSGLSAYMAWDVDPLPAGLINAIIIAAAVLLTLLVVAIGLSLSATESRDERDVLLAVGAPPRTLSRIAGAKAFVLAGTAVVLAVPTGYLPTWVVYRTVGDSVPVPWLTIGLLVVVVPLAVGAVSWFASSVARRVRPVHAPTPFAD